MRRWHEERGTKGDVIYHSIMIVLYTIILPLIVARFLITWINDKLNVGILLYFLLFLFIRFTHKLSLNRNVSKYAKYNTYRKNNHSKFDKYVLLLMNHYIKKWKPEPFMCCSFKYFEPKDAYKNLDFKEIKSYGKKGISYDACYLYQCKKCGKYVLSLEYHQDKHCIYVPISHAENADTYSKEWSHYYVRTTSPILHVIDNICSWENKS
jgi:hypothetical protein